MSSFELFEPSSCSSESSTWPEVVARVRESSSLRQQRGRHTADVSGCAARHEASSDLSATKAIHTSTGKKKKVTKASQTSMTSGVMTCKIITSHTYAKTDAVAVTAYTFGCTILRESEAGMACTHTAMMTSKLNAAEPTIVDGPSSPE